MSAIIDAFLRELDDDALAELARRLEPHLARQPDGDDGWLRGADAIASHIGATKSRVFRLAASNAIPVQREGRALLARRSELDTWLRAGGGRKR